MKTKFATLFMALMMTAVFARAADASNITLTLSDGTNTYTVGPSATGVISFSGAVGDWTVNMTTGLASPFLPSGFMDLGSIDATSQSGTASTLTVSFTQQDVSPRYPGFRMELGATVSGGLANVNYAAYADTTNAAFGQQQLIGNLSFNTQSSPFSGTTYSSVSVGNLYSLTQVLTINGGGVGTQSRFSGNANLVPLPEPGSLMLLGGGLIGLAGLARRRLRSKS